MTVKKRPGLSSQRRILRATLLAAIPEDNHNGTLKVWRLRPELDDLLDQAKRLDPSSAASAWIKQTSRTCAPKRVNYVYSGKALPPKCPWNGHSFFKSIPVSTEKRFAGRPLLLSYWTAPGCEPPRNRHPSSDRPRFRLSESFKCVRVIGTGPSGTVILRSIRKVGFASDFFAAVSPEKANDALSPVKFLRRARGR